jgi:hypothetical protein
MNAVQKVCSQIWRLPSQTHALPDRSGGIRRVTVISISQGASDFKEKRYKCKVMAKVLLDKQRVNLVKMSKMSKIKQQQKKKKGIQCQSRTLRHSRERRSRMCRTFFMMEESKLRVKCALRL